MNLIILHTDDGEAVGLNADHIVSFNAASTTNFPRTKTVIHFVDSEGGMRVRESFEHVCRIIQGTATAKQEAAERADLDERLAALEMARDNLAADYREIVERVTALENKGRALNVANVALQDAHNGLVDRIKQLEDGLRGLRRHVMGQEGRDYGERP